MNNHAISKAKCFFLKMRILFFSSLAMGYTACAQTIENPRIKGRPGIVPIMKVTYLQKNETNPMKIDELKIDIKVLGHIAMTTMEFSYFNTNSRVMEGEFNFPLAEGQTVSRF